MLKSTQLAQLSIIWHNMGTVHVAEQLSIIKFNIGNVAEYTAASTKYKASTIKHYQA